MKKVIAGLLLCFAIAGCKDQGSAFVGTWKGGSGQEAETLVIEKVSGGFRVDSKMADPNWSFVDSNELVTAESDTRLINEGKEKALELVKDGELISYLRTKPMKFEKVK